MKKFFFTMNPRTLEPSVVKSLILLVISTLLSLTALAEDGKITYMVPMRDGVKLATDVYLPKGKGPFPVILSRTPYGKNLYKLIKDFLLPMGKKYVLIVQDMRGRFDSEGTSFVFFDDGWGEKQDGYDAIEWIAKQDWSNGKICTVGASAGGIEQNMTAGALPPHLVCQVIIVAASSLYHQGAFQGGAFRKGLAEGWIKSNNFPQYILDKFATNTNYNSLWAQVDSETKHNIMSVPALHIGGWFDIFSQGTLNSFKGRQENGGEGAKGNQKLLMGPWVHGIGMKNVGELEFPKADALFTKVIDGTMKFLDYWLRGIDNGIMKKPAVAYYLMGDVDVKSPQWNVWKDSDIWPLPSKETPFYFRSNGRLTSDKPVEKEISDTFLYDPKNPVPTAGGANMSEGSEGPSGPRDQRKVEERKDVILYTTDTLTEPLEIVGKLKVDLYASSDAVDTDFTAKLIDVYPDGRSILMQDGIIRAKHRESMEKEVLMESGKIYSFEIDMWSTAYVFNKGHKIRVEISSSNYPRFDVNPNTGNTNKIIDLKNDTTVVAKNTIYHDLEYSSRILLPVIEGSKQ